MGFFAVKANFLLYYIWRFPANPDDFNGVVLGVGDHTGGEDPIWTIFFFFLEIELHELK